MQSLERMHDAADYWTLIQLAADSWPERSTNAVVWFLGRTKVYLDCRGVDRPLYRHVHSEIVGEPVKEWLLAITEPAIVTIDLLALLIVVGSTLEAFFNTCYRLFAPTPSHEWRQVWLHYARWLVAALTFQLAADIIETSVTTGWEALGRIGIIAVIRTFLNYYLEKDIAEIRERRGAREQEPV